MCLIFAWYSSLQVKTVVPGLKPEQQAKAKWLVEMFAPFLFTEPNHLYIKVDKDAAKAGETLDFQLHLSVTSNMETDYSGQVTYTVSHTSFPVLLLFSVLSKGCMISVFNTTEHFKLPTFPTPIH